MDTISATTCYNHWVKHFSDQNIFVHNGKIIDSESAFASSGLHSEPSPSFEEWLSSRI
ncbi:hypothetical protein MPL1_10447 [Methylophaga lonarensis MPL]|uniref:Uncharacterized protein n=1 Tax=Methylophaga lonarensis MPL TaxID=1286106 RepID=M7NYN7_9GAMM|nr:hypothetical protein MPL1_10447 [Methylophaga lonarensis MPL]